MFFDTPIIINNFNRLGSTKKMVEDLEDLGYSNIHIIDNSSTYSPLLDWYSTLSLPIERTHNHGSLALWNSGYINKFKIGEWIAYTDSDLELNPQTPKGFVNRLIETSKHYNIPKCGLALSLDFPTSTEYGRAVKEWERKFWEIKLEANVYRAQIDTTFAVFQVGTPFQYEALRIAGNYTARHIPWETDWDNLSEEEEYFLIHSSPWSTYKREYVRYLQERKNQIIT